MRYPFQKHFKMIRRCAFCTYSYSKVHEIVKQAIFQTVKFDIGSKLFINFKINCLKYQFSMLLRIIFNNIMHNSMLTILKNLSKIRKHKICTKYFLFFNYFWIILHSIIFQWKNIVFLETQISFGRLKYSFYLFFNDWNNNTELFCTINFNVPYGMFKIERFSS